MSETDICQECGHEFPSEHLYYADDGGMICKQCEASRDVSSGLRNGYIAMGTGALSLAVVSFCINCAMIPSILSIIASIQTLRYPTTLSPDERQPLRDLGWVKVLAVLAMVIGIGNTLLSGLTMLAVF